MQGPARLEASLITLRVHQRRSICHPVLTTMEVRPLENSEQISDETEPRTLTYDMSPTRSTSRSQLQDAMGLYVHDTPMVRRSSGEAIS